MKHRSEAVRRAGDRGPWLSSVRKEERGRLASHAEESAVVRQIFERAADDKKGTEIARWLSDSGHRTKGTAGKAGGLWTGRTVL